MVVGSASWHKAKYRYMRTYRNVCRWHEKVGFDEMIDHRLLSDDRLVQESAVSSGWRVVVNCGDSRWKDPRGFSVSANDSHMFQP